MKNIFTIIALLFLSSCSIDNEIITTGLGNFYGCWMDGTNYNISILPKTIESNVVYYSTADLDCIQSTPEYGMNQKYINDTLFIITNFDTQGMIVKDDSLNVFVFDQDHNIIKTLKYYK